RKHFGGDLKGKVLLTAGLGGMGGAQPLAGGVAGAVVLGGEVDPSRSQKRHDTKYVDELATDIDDAIQRVEKYKKDGKAVSIALCGNMSEIIHELIKRDFIPDMLTDQTSAHDPLVGYIPAGLTLDQADDLRKNDPKRYVDQ